MKNSFGKNEFGVKQFKKLVVNFNAPSDFSCVICSELLYDPMECSECQNTFCGECLKDWLARGSDTCPACSKEKSEYTAMHRKLKNQMNNIMVKCKCDEEVQYDKLADHYKTCI